MFGKKIHNKQIIRGWYLTDSNAFYLVESNGSIECYCRILLGVRQIWLGKEAKRIPYGEDSKAFYRTLCLKKPKSKEDILTELEHYLSCSRPLFFDNDLKMSADFVIDGTLTTDEQIKKIKEYLREKS